MCSIEAQELTIYSFVFLKVFLIYNTRVRHFMVLVAQDNDVIHTVVFTILIDVVKF